MRSARGSITRCCNSPVHQPAGPSHGSNGTWPCRLFHDSSPSMKAAARAGAWAASFPHFFFIFFFYIFFFFFLPEIHGVLGGAWLSGSAVQYVPVWLHAAYK